MKRKPYGSHEYHDNMMVLIFTDNPRTRTVEMSYDGYCWYVESTSYHHAVDEAISLLHLYKFVRYQSRGLVPPLGVPAILICVPRPYSKAERKRREASTRRAGDELTAAQERADRRRVYEKSHGLIAPH